MSNNQKEYFFYPAITAIVMSGINAYADWKRGTLESIWWYVVAALNRSHAHHIDREQIAPEHRCSGKG